MRACGLSKQLHASTRGTTQQRSSHPRLLAARTAFYASSFGVLGREDKSVLCCSPLPPPPISLDILSHYRLRSKQSLRHAATQTNNLQRR